MIKGFYHILIYLSTTSVLVPFYYSIRRYKAFNQPLKALFLYLVISLLTEVVSNAFSYYNVRTNLPFQLFTVFEYFSIIYIYYKELKLVKNYFILSLSVFFTIVAFIKFSPIQSNDIVASTEALIIVGLAVYYFYKVSGDVSIQHVTENYFFWINTGFLFYFGIAFFIFLFDNYIRHSDELTGIYLLTIHLFANIIYNILLTIGIWKAKPTYQS